MIQSRETQEVRLSTSPHQLHTTHPQDRSKRQLQELIQAVVDDDIDAIQRVLDVNPGCLLMEPVDEKILEVKSKYTQQRVIAEKAFVMVRKLNNYDVMKTMIPYFAKLNRTTKSNGNHTEDEKSELLKQWMFKSISTEERKEQVEKLQQKYINEVFNPLIKEMITIKQGDYGTVIVNEQTQKSIDSFRKKLLPDTAVAIDDSFDPIVLFLASCSAYITHINDFQNESSRDLFANQIMGFIQSLFAPHVLLWCYGFPQDKNNYYRSNHEARTGLGYDFHYDSLGIQSVLNETRFRDITTLVREQQHLLKNYLSTFDTVRFIYTQVTSPPFVPAKAGCSCVIA